MILDAYIAVPYSTGGASSEDIREERYELVTRITGEIIKRGINAFSPITHSHPLTQYSYLPGGWNFWKEIDIPYIDASKCVAVYMLDGWMDSIRVLEEMQHAIESGKPVFGFKTVEDFMFKYNKYVIRGEKYD